MGAPAQETRPAVGDGRLVDFSAAPERTNDKFPLSDQANTGNWRPQQQVSDEFRGSRLNTRVWYENNPKWKGRPPTFFHASNVSVEDGELVLRVNQHGDTELPDGYTDTAGFIKSKQRIKYGYFEAELKVMDGPFVSCFWMTSVTPDWWTEIDVCENCPVTREDGRDQAFDLNSNIHVFRAPEDKGNVTEHFSRSEKFKVPFRLQDGYHVWGCEWDAGVIRFYIDGGLFREAENTHWHQPLEINVNNESDEWFGALPEFLDGPSDDLAYRVKYVRVWQRPGAEDGAPY